MSNRPADIKAVVQGTQAVLRTIPGIGTVERRLNPAAPWSTGTGAYQALWVVTHRRSAVQFGGGASAPGRGGDLRLREITVDGWMPYGFDANTDSQWRTALQNVLLTLIRNVTLGVGAKMRTLPGLELNRRETYTSLHQGDVPVLCHRGRICFTVLTYYPVTAS